MGIKQSIRKLVYDLCITKKLNVLLGSGASMPAMPSMGNMKAVTLEERNHKLIDEIKIYSTIILEIDNADSKNDNLEKLSPLIVKSKAEKIYDVLKKYEMLIGSLIDILFISNSRQVPKSVNIFTTNYDLFIEKAIDDVAQNVQVVFNDGARGYFNRILNSTNFNQVVAYKGLNDNYNNEIPSITLIKPHGSVNWEMDDSTDNVYVRNCVVKKPFVVPPDHFEEKRTFLDNHFHEMLRVFQLELDKPQSVLLVFGFSFQDKHIAKMVKRALQNRELMIICFCYSEKAANEIKKNLGMSQIPKNFKLLKPSEMYDDTNNQADSTFELSDLIQILEGDRNGGSNAEKHETGSNH